MFRPASQIVAEIMEYMHQCGGPPSTWYVGIAKEPTNRLFNDHGVLRQGDAWIFRQALSSEEARRAEAHLVSTLGTDGGSGGGDRASAYVYAYKKSNHSHP